MKKLFFFVLFVFAISGLSLTASADMSGPGIVKYEVYIAQERGAFVYGRNYDDERVYNTGEKFLYGEKVEVSDSYIDGYVECYYSAEVDSPVKFDAYLLKSEDVSLTIPKVLLDKSYKLYKPVKFAVIKEGFYLYSGPGTVYEKISEEIPVGTELQFEYFYFHENFMGVQWVYVNYGVVGGWANVRPYGYDGYRTAFIAGESYEHTDFDEEYDSWRLDYTIESYAGSLYIAKEGVRLTDIPAYSPDGEIEINYISEELPVGKKFEFKYFYNEIESDYALIKYKGVEGWVRINADAYRVMDHTAVEYLNYDLKDYNWSIDETLSETVYKKPFDVTSKVLGTVKNSTGYKIRYCARLGTLESQDVWYGIDYGSGIGWICISENEKVMAVYNNSYEEEEETMLTTEKETETTTEVSLSGQAVTETGETIRYDSSKSTVKIIAYSVITAVVLALTAGVTVILVNRKKKEKRQ